MKIILVTATLLSFFSTVLAGELVSITASNGINRIMLNNVQKQYIYGKAISHLETCKIGNPSEATQKLSEEAILELEKIMHIKITFNKNYATLPVGTKFVDVKDIYVLYYSPENALAQIVTIQPDKIQHYSKCSGHSSLYNLSCDKVISKIMLLKNSSCKTVSLDYEKRL